MLGFITGSVLFSDGKEAIIQSRSGVGYQLHCYSILPEGGKSSMFISHIVRETSEELYSFKSLREKKLFELLITVKGVGPRSAYSVLAQLGDSLLISAIKSEDKTILKSISGVGEKAASQMILDLKKKVESVMMYSDKSLKFNEMNFEFEESSHNSPLRVLDLKSSNAKGALEPNSGINSGPNSGPNSKLNLESSLEPSLESNLEPNSKPNLESSLESNFNKKEEILNEALRACQNLGFQNDKVIPLAQRILKEHEIQRTEQLVHLVLKEI